MKEEEKLSSLLWKCRYEHIHKELSKKILWSCNVNPCIFTYRTGHLYNYKLLNERLDTTLREVDHTHQDCFHLQVTFASKKYFPLLPKRFLKRRYKWGTKNLQGALYIQTTLTRQSKIQPTLKSNAYRELSSSLANELARKEEKRSSANTSWRANTNAFLDKS